MSTTMELFTETPNMPGYPCVFSVDRKYRYVLWRVWANPERPRYLQVIGLNPSTADETNDDPTIRRCIGFAKAWGFDALCMTNLFAFRSTDPADMKREADPVGPENDEWIERLADYAGLIVAAWGVHGDHRARSHHVTELLRSEGLSVYSLGTTKDGAPRHPLYLPKSAVPVPYPPALV